MKLTSTEHDNAVHQLAKIEAYQQEQLAAALAMARDDAERAALLAHATTPGECDAEYCPWAQYKESLCIRDQEVHDINCRCADCCSDYDD